MKIALGQLDMVWEDKEASLHKVESMVQEAVRQKAELIVFPEMTLTGFSMNLFQIGEKPQQSETVLKMQTLAKKYDIGIGFGWAALGDAPGAKGTNHFTLVDEAGTLLGDYTKIHPFSYGGESLVYQGGDKILTVPFHGRRLGLFVCYDLRFPEVFQVASRQADILLVIANWPDTRRDHWMALLQARAIENQSYVVGVNCVGYRNHLHYAGDSMAVDALGQMIGTQGEREGVLVCHVDDRAWSLRQKFQSKPDRREALYQRLLGEDEIKYEVEQNGKV